MSVTVIDFSSGPPSAKSIREAGHDGAVLYISLPRESWMTGKNPTRAYLDSLDREGIKFAFVFQYRKGGSMALGDAGRSYEGGIADAREAKNRLDSLNCAGHPVYFAVDWDVTLNEWNKVVYRYFTGAVEVLGRQRVGIYGHSRAVHWAMEDGVVAEVEPGRVLGWVTQSWQSRHPNGTPKGSDYATLFQGTHNVPGPEGVKIDINETFHDEWGWRALPDYKEAKPGFPDGVELDDLPRVDEHVWLNKHYSVGRSRKIKYVTRHHLAGIGDARWAWGIWQQRAASAHYVVGPDGTVGQLVKRKDTAWGNANSGSNHETIVLEHSNSGGAPGWPISDKVILRGAELAAELCIVEKLGRPEFGKNIRDHREFTATSCPHHLAWGEKYHNQWMNHAQQHYDRLIGLGEEELMSELSGVSAAALNDAKVAAQEARDNTREILKILKEKRESLINPDHSFTSQDYDVLVDAATWEARVLAEETARKLGIDPEEVVEKAILEDRGEK